MQTRVSEMLGVEFPLLAFSHCRDVVAAVTNAGGFGVLGAVAYTPERLEEELRWIDGHVAGRAGLADRRRAPRALGLPVRAVRQVRRARAEPGRRPRPPDGPPGHDAG